MADLDLDSSSFFDSFKLVFGDLFAKDFAKSFMLFIYYFYIEISFRVGVLFLVGVFVRVGVADRVGVLFAEVLVGVLLLILTKFLEITDIELDGFLALFKGDLLLDPEAPPDTILPLSLFRFGVTVLF